MNWALVSTETNKVANIIVWDGVSEWIAPNDMLVINVDNQFVGIDFIYDPQTGTFSEPLEE